MDDESLCESLIIWLNTFDEIEALKSNAVELSDGVAMCQCLALIAPDWFDDEWMSKVKKDAGDNWRLKCSNLKKLLKGIMDYYTEVLNMDIVGFTLPDVSCIEYIQNIMQMEESVQHVVMTAIQELMACKDVSSSVDNDTYKDLEVQHKTTLEQLRSTMAQKEEISQRCHELDEQLSLLREHHSTLETENHILRKQLNSKSDESGQSADASERLNQLQQQVELLKEQNFSLESSRDEFRIKCSTYEKENLDLSERIEQLQSLAEESQQLRDEMDVLRHTQEKVAKYESTIDSYKKKLEELTEMRKQMKSMEEKNASYMQQTIDLQEDLKKANALKTQLETYKKQVHQLQSSVSENERRADKAEFESKRVKEKMVQLQGENERLKQERNTLREKNEELTLNEVSRTTGDKSSFLSDSSDNFFMADLPPEARERIILLEHQNKKLKELSDGAESEQTELLKSLLEDANAAKEQLKKETRELNQRNMELESELEEMRNQQSSLREEKENELQQKYMDHLQKLKDANDELQKKKTYMESLEPGTNATAEKVNELQELLNKKDQETKAMEAKYKKYLEKAKSVIKTLDPKQNTSANGPEIDTLKNQLQEKEKFIEHLERNNEKMKLTREREEKLMVTAWYEMAMQLHKKAAEERLSGGPGMSFLARQRQAARRRSSNTKQAQTASSR
ncbi:protein Hook homolog 3-like isoform X2 [Xenia sp. Carnegie-2017]|uniref:protein Hook homolog 3-like isoform X2 n=1 Tax=Xenia sp. Carnegie-2017 TaxID=2897299 RepID=UPI001F04DEBD|nr:protein Hook homolog 3-like isoform X2 [Xenia sp. Carnegie-2017]